MGRSGNLLLYYYYQDYLLLLLVEHLLTVAGVLADFRYRAPWAFNGPRSRHDYGDYYY